MMKSRTPYILFIATLVVLILPLIQQHTQFPRFRKLTGVVEEKPMPEINYDNVAHQKVQGWIESYLQRHYGFKEPLTRLYNQYLWDCYDLSNVVKNKKIFISDDGWIYESQHVEEYYVGKGRWYGKDSLSMAKYFGEEALRLYQLQKILEEQHTHLFVLLLPGKESIYPEHVPQTDDYQGEKVFSATEFYSQKFKELGVNHIDVNQWFLELKDQVDYPLYPQTGTHWSNYAAMQVADSLIRYMEQLGGMKIAHIEIGERREETVYPDNDLEQLMNLIRPLPKATNYYADTRIIPDSTAQKPVIITIGDSYYWNLLNATPFADAMEKTPYWYYYNTVYFDEPCHNIKEVDVMQEVLDADFVMLAYCTPQIYEMSQGFSQQLLLDICCNEEDFERAQKTLAAEIRKNPVWMELLVELANEYDFTIDTVVNGEAKNTILKRPSPYIPALRDTIPTKRSRKYTIAINRDNEEVLEMMEKIREDSLWYNSVVKQAEKRHLSAEDNLCLNAVYVLEKLKKK